MGRPALRVHPTLQKAIEIMGSRRALARAIDCSHQNIAQWERVPAEMVPRVAAVTGLSPAWLRPEVFGSPLTRLARKRRA
jgi:DNA-binding transcriptional regulator YdaS (Cro superfamily)